MLSWDEYDDNADKAPPPPIVQESAEAVIYNEPENSVPIASIEPVKGNPIPVATNHSMPAMESYELSLIHI